MSSLKTITLAVINATAHAGKKTQPIIATNAWTNFMGEKSCSEAGAGPSHRLNPARRYLLTYC
jgi:hypothetical protein